MIPPTALDLAPGSGLVLDGVEWTVERHEPHLGRVVLRDPAGARQQLTFRQATDRQALRLLAAVQAQLREPPGPDRAIGDVVRNSSRNSPPLRVVLARKEPVTQKAILGYRDARHREWRPAAANNDWVQRVTDTSAK
ncbi:hypothetical protein [Streptomyces sp. B21-083]|uniref:hypothetical protein n=1 Tax=Streptomyces sp. B21-083 TaxID=3039410 RepID=UPI002FF03F60